MFLASSALQPAQVKLRAQFKSYSAFDTWDEYDSDVRRFPPCTFKAESNWLTKDTEANH